MTGGCLAGEARLFSLKPCHVKHTCALWDFSHTLVIASERADSHFWPALRPPTNTPCYKMEGSGVKGQALLSWNRKCWNKTRYTLTATASNMWTRLMCSCCGPDIDSLSSYRSIRGPVVVHSSVAPTCMFCLKCYQCRKGLILILFFPFISYWEI